MISTQQSIQGQWGMRKVLIEINCESTLPLVKVGVKGKEDGENKVLFKMNFDKKREGNDQLPRSKKDLYKGKV